MRPPGARPSLEALRHEGEQLVSELTREYYRSGAGLTAAPELTPIYDRHRAVASPASLATARAAFLGAAEGTEEHRAASHLLEWQVELHSARELATLEERELAWEASAVVRLSDGRQIEYERATIDIANTSDRAERIRIDEARTSLIAAELAPMRRERLARERELTEELEIGPSYIEAFERLNGFSLRDLAAECEAFLSETQAMWGDVLPPLLRRELGVEISDARRSDASALFRGRGFDAYFPANALQHEIFRQVTEMGIDPTAGGRARVDAVDRPGKRARAFCAPVRVPDEVYLVIRPHGGQADWTTFLHELGHTLHYANIAPMLPFEDRYLGDNSVTEAYAMLFDHLMQDRGWVKRYSELGLRVPEFSRWSAIEELHMLRRYCAKLIYELELYSGDVPVDELPDRYAERLTRATSFAYDRALAFVDVDLRFYSARYLRAWQLQSLIAEALIERFDADWWRNPRAGPWLVSELFAWGQRDEGRKLADRVIGRPPSFTPLVRAIEARLQ